MRRMILVLCGASLVPWALGAQSAVPVFKEPHHRTLLYTNQFRIFDVSVPPGGTSLEHLHDRDVATIAITGGAAPAGTLAVTEYAGKPSSHAVANTDKVLSRLIAVENNRESGWTSPGAMKAPATTLNRETRAFYLYDVRLDATTAETEHAHQLPAITVLVSGVVENQGDGGTEPFLLQQPGGWLYTPMATAHTLRVPAGRTAHVVEIEVR
jgi:hypothetical protein